MWSLLVWSKVITLSGFQCIDNFSHRIYWSKWRIPYLNNVTQSTMSSKQKSSRIFNWTKGSQQSSNHLFRLFADLLKYSSKCDFFSFSIGKFNKLLLLQDTGATSTSWWPTCSCTTRRRRNEESVALLCLLLLRTKFCQMLLLQKMHQIFGQFFLTSNKQQWEYVQANLLSILTN